MSEQLSLWFKAYSANALRLKQRGLVILAGDSAWAMTLLQHLPGFPVSTGLNTTESKAVWHIYSDDADVAANLSRQNYRHQLGSESQVIVFADSGLNIDAFAALSGTLVAGGTLFVVCPEFLIDAEQSNKGAFFQRFVSKIKTTQQHIVLTPNAEQQQQIFAQQLWLDKQSSAAQKTRKNETPLPLLCATQEQYLAVQHIIKVVSGHRDRPLVLTADRGRGKSSALAIACAELLKNGVNNANSARQHIIITAPHQQALQVFFKQLKRSLPDAIDTATRVEYNNSVLEFMPIDVLLAAAPKPSLVLVDEAAAIPVYLLANLLKSYHRLVFSSTVHGYEGAGRGFTIKFLALLVQRCPQWQGFHIKQAIRWCQDDPLETFVFELCLLNARLADIAAPQAQDIVHKVQDKAQDKTQNTAQHPAKDKTQHKGSTKQPPAVALGLPLSFARVTRQDLIADEDLLSQVFSVLVTAHYQTTPSDLKMLLDNPQLQLLTLNCNKQVVAVALLMLEGGADCAAVSAVKNNKRRLKNQFIPQSLLTHNGFDKAFEYQYLRVMRIAVHPGCQQQGIGSELLKKVDGHARQLGVDFLGSSFGVNQQLLPFWLKAGYQLARIGFSPDSASGEHSAMLLKALKPHSQEFLGEIQYQFYRTFDHLLYDEYQHLSPELVALVLHQSPQNSLPMLTRFDLNAVSAFSQGQRLFSHCVFSLHLWLRHRLTQAYDPSIFPLISRILLKKSIAEVCHRYQLTGKKSLNQHIQSYYKNHLKDIN